MWQYFANTKIKIKFCGPGGNMEINTHQEENYLHVATEGRFDSDEWQKFWEIIEDESNPQNWLIMEISEEETPLSAPFAVEMVSLNAHCQDNGGLLIVVADNRNFEDQLEELSIMSIPSLDEAIDYIFIEQLERDLGPE